MKIRNIFFATILSLPLLSCTTTVRDSVWRSIDDHSKAYISLNMAEKSLNRIKARLAKTEEGWIETGTWVSTDETNKIQVWVYVYSLLDKVFTNKHKEDLEETIREISGDGYLTFDEKDQIKTRLGPVDIQYYELSGLNCFFVESFWTSGIANSYNSVLRNASGGEYMIGDNLLHAYYCEDSGNRFEFEDVEGFLQSIHVRLVYWPEDRFAEVGEQL